MNGELRPTRHGALAVFLIRPSRTPCQALSTKIVLAGVPSPWVGASEAVRTAYRGTVRFANRMTDRSARLK
jgi:hypothetical protein